MLGGYGLIHVATQFPEKIIGKVKKLLRKQNSNRGAWFRYILNTLDILFFSALKHNIARLMSFKKSHRRNGGTRYPFRKDIKSLRVREKELAPLVQKFVVAVWEIDYSKKYIPPLIDELTRDDDNVDNTSMEKRKSLLENVSKKDVDIIVTSIANERRSSDGVIEKEKRQRIRNLKKVRGNENKKNNSNSINIDNSDTESDSDWDNTTEIEDTSENEEYFEQATQLSSNYIHNYATDTDIETDSEESKNEHKTKRNRLTKSKNKNKDKYATDSDDDDYVPAMENVGSKKANKPITSKRKKQVQIKAKPKQKPQAKKQTTKKKIDGTKLSGKLTIKNKQKQKQTKSTKKSKKIN